MVIPIPLLDFKLQNVFWCSKCPGRLTKPRFVKIAILSRSSDLELFEILQFGFGIQNRYIQEFCIFCCVNVIVVCVAFFTFNFLGFIHVKFITLFKIHVAYYPLITAINIFALFVCKKNSTKEYAKFNPSDNADS